MRPPMSKGVKMISSKKICTEIFTMKGRCGFFIQLQNISNDPTDDCRVCKLRNRFGIENIGNGRRERVSFCLYIRKKWKIASFSCISSLVIFLSKNLIVFLVSIEAATYFAFLFSRIIYFRLRCS